MSAIRSTRRTFLGGVAVAGAATASGAGIALAADPMLTASVVENPDLLAAYDRLKSALAERDEATSALQWIADEWRHLWPLAPEELLGGANADKMGGTFNRDAERDIVGSYLMRDTAALTTRLSREFRSKNAKVCFTVATEEHALEKLDRWTGVVPKGRTVKSLKRSRLTREWHVAKASREASLARQYEQETQRLRQAAGVEKAQRRITRAEDSLLAVCKEISLMPARGHDGIRIKAHAIASSGFLSTARKCGGVLAEMARFIDEVAGFDGRASE